ncbi:MAG: putative Na+/H+ antiporter [Burkholderiaceae bacterium]|nr:putative Na+/H+ antiporter [Burkholderiaceae bacterium]
MPSASPSLIDLIAAALFAIAVIHTFSVKYFERLAHTHPRHAGIWHLLGEIEVVFGFWAMVLVVCIFALDGSPQATAYLDSRNFTEPMFVFAIMVIAASRPVLELANALVRALVRVLPMQPALALYFVVLAFVPLLGSFITEPAAMTIAALMIRDLLFTQQVSNRFKYLTLGVLFVNISIGGTLTPFAAPPVLMVAAKWNWDIGFMLSNFGWKAAIAVGINTVGAILMLRTELRRLDVAPSGDGMTVPLPLVMVHLLFLIGVVVFAHHPSVFISLLLFFMGVATAYRHHQSPLILREGLLVAFFLAGLVVLGGKQQWWLQPTLMQMSEQAVFIGAAALTAFTDNAALTYLGSLVEGLSPAFQYSLVAGAVAGGGLTVIANAPNPAGVAILRERFDDQTIHPLGLLFAALPPTLVAMLAFRFL